MRIWGDVKTCLSEGRSLFQRHSPEGVTIGASVPREDVILVVLVIE